MIEVLQTQLFNWKLSCTRIPEHKFQVLNPLFKTIGLSFSELVDLFGCKLDVQHINISVYIRVAFWVPTTRAQARLVLGLIKTSLEPGAGPDRAEAPCVLIAAPHPRVIMIIKSYYFAGRAQHNSVQRRRWSIAKASGSSSKIYKSEESASRLPNASIQRLSLCAYVYKQSAFVFK